MKVENITSNRTNRPIANQFYIFGDDGSITFQSYKSVIAVWKNPTLILKGNMWDYSNTTRKYFYKFIEEMTNLRLDNKKAVLKAIKEDINIIIEEVV